MATYNLNKSVLVTTNDDVDAKFRVANNTERDNLITLDRVKIGHIIYHELDNIHYKLDTYPTAGSLVGVIWLPLNVSISAAEVKTLYESNPNTNAFEDDEKIKLSTVEGGATADQTGSEIKILYELEPNTNAFTDSEKSKLASLDTRNGSPVQDIAELIAISESSLSDKEKRFVEDEGNDFYYDQQSSGPADSDTLAPSDQTGGTGFWVRIQTGSSETPSSIKTKYESNADTNAFTDLEKTKLSNIENNAKDDQNASEVPFTPTGNTLSNNVQSAIEELQSEIDNFTIADNSITNSLLSDMPENTFKGRSAGLGDPEDLTVTQVRSILEIDLKVVNIEILTAGEVLVPNDIVYLNTDGKYYKADNSSFNTTKGDIRLCLDNIAADSTGRFALKILAPGLTLPGEIIGDNLYLGTSGGFINTTGRNALTTGFQSRVIGTVSSLNGLYFNPDKTVFEIA